MADRSSSNGVAFRRVLPVFWIMSRFHAMVPTGQYRTRRYISGKKIRQVAVPVGRRTTTVYCVFVGVHKSTAPGGKGGEVSYLRLPCVIFGTTRLCRSAPPSM